MTTVKTEDFKRAVLALKGIKPVGGMVLIEFEKKEITFTTGNQSYGWVFRIDYCDGITRFKYNSVCIPLNALLLLLDKITSQVITLLPSGLNLDLHQNDLLLSVAEGVTEYYYDYPAVPEITKSQAIIDSQGEVCTIRRKFKKATEFCLNQVKIIQKPPQKILPRLNIRVENGEMIADSTNGRIRVQCQFVVTSKDTFQFSVPHDFSTKLLKQKWDIIKITNYEDYIIASDEIGKIKCQFYCKKLNDVSQVIGEWETRRKETMASAVESKLDPKPLFSFLNGIKDLCDATTLICDNENIQVCGFGKPVTSKKIQVHQTSIARTGDGFTWTNFITSTMVLALAPIPKSVKAIAIYIGDVTKPLPIIIQYSQNVYRFTIEVVPTQYRPTAPQLKAQQRLVKRYTPQECEVLGNNLKTDDRPDGDQELSQ